MEKVVKCFSITICGMTRKDIMTSVHIDIQSQTKINTQKRKKAWVQCEFTKCIEI
jgi:hypothetical protein